jgi:hypothetical protein
MVIFVTFIVVYVIVNVDLTMFFFINSEIYFDIKINLFGVVDQIAFTEDLEKIFYIYIYLFTSGE